MSDDKHISIFWFCFIALGFIAVMAHIGTNHIQVMARIEQGR